MDKHLRVRTGPDAGRTFPLPDTGSLNVGRSHQHTDICLHDPHCARVHCYLEIEGDKVTVVAVDDEAPVLVNGDRVARQELTPTDIVGMGDTTFALEFPFLASGAKAAPPTQTAGLPGLVGQKFGYFSISSILGQGHHGIVFGAHDHQHQRDVALKLLKPEFPADTGELGCFSAAIKKVLPLRHPHLVALYGAGKTGPYCWLALERIDGMDVGRMLKEKDGKPVDVPLALKVGADITRALIFAWKHGLGHRNLTPANILWDKQKKVAKLSDLGFRQAIASSRLHTEAREKKLLAELSFLAPEQAAPDGYVEDLVDIYRLGAILYMLMTGRPPFQGHTTEETLEHIQNREPVRPHRRNKQVPEDVERIVLKMLARRQEDRYLAAGELLADLEEAAEQYD